MARAKKKNRSSGSGVEPRWNTCAGCGGSINLNNSDWVVLMTKQTVHHAEDCLSEVRRKDNVKLSNNFWETW